MKLEHLYQHGCPCDRCNGRIPDEYDYPPSRLSAEDEAKLILDMQMEIDHDCGVHIENPEPRWCEACRHQLTQP